MPVSPVIALVNVPNDIPSFVFVVKAIVGLGLVLHTIPLSVTGAPPSFEMDPPHEAVVWVIDDTIEVVNVGSAIGEPVVKEASLE